VARFQAKVWRHVPAGAQALNFGWLLKASGRWNRRGVYGCLYTAFSEDGARAELEKLRAAATPASGGVAFASRELVSINVSVEPVLDLTDPEVIKTLGVDVSALLGDDDASLERCRTVSDYARAQGFRAIIVPSAALVNAKNLVVFLDGAAHELELEDGPDRIPV